MVRSPTCLDADQRRWQLAEEANHLTSLQLPPLDALAFIIDGVNQKDRLRDIQSDRNDLVHDMHLSPLWRRQGVERYAVEIVSEEVLFL